MPQPGPAPNENHVAAEDHHSAGEILAHPRFPAARKAYIDAVLAIYENKPWVNRLMYDSGRMMVFMVLICLYARYDPADRSTWPTVGRLKDTLKPLGVASPRQIDLVLARLQSIGLLELRVADGDQRMRLFQPSEAMLGHDRDWLAAHYAPLAIMFPHEGYDLPLSRDKRFQMAHRAAAGEVLGRTGRNLSANPGMSLFLSRHSAAMILIKLFQAADGLNGEFRVSLSYAETAARFGVSRTHIRTLFGDAQDQGLLRIFGRGGAEIEIMPTLVRDFDRFVANGMSSRDITWRLAMRRINDPGAGEPKAIGGPRQILAG